MMSLAEGDGQEPGAHQVPPSPPFTALLLVAEPSQEGLSAQRTERVSCSLPALHAGTSKSSSLPAYGRTTLSRVRSQTRGCMQTVLEACACRGASEGPSYLPSWGSSETPQVKGTDEEHASFFLIPLCPF